MSGKSGAPGSRKKKDNEKKDQLGGSDQLITANTFTGQDEADIDSDEEKITVELLLQQLQQQNLQFEQQRKLQEQQLQKQQAVLDQLLKQQSVKSEPITHVQSQNVQQLRIELFGSPQPTTIGELPKYTVGDRFASWKQQVESHIGTYGLDIMIVKSPSDSWAEAVALKPAHVPLSMLQQWFIQAGKRIVHAISLVMVKAGLDRDQLLADARADKPDHGVVTVGPLRIDVDANPYLIMQTLREKYDTKTPYAAINIWKRLLASRWDPSREKGSKHLQSLRDLFMQLDRLAADDRPKNGECFGETIKSIIMLNTLPQTFSTEVKILTTQEKITTAQVEAVIRKYDDIASRGTSNADTNTDRAHAFTSARSQHKAQKQQRAQHSTQSKSSRNHHRSAKESGRSRSSRHRRHSSDSSSSDDSSSDSDQPSSKSKYAEQEECNEPASFCLIDEPIAKSNKGKHDSHQRSRVLLDSGATCHVWNDPSTVYKQHTLTKPKRMSTATGELVSVTKTGLVQLTSKVKMKDVAIVPTATSNLMSVDKITKAGFTVSFYDDAATIRNNKWKVVLKFKKQDGLYVFHPDQEERPSPSRQQSASRPSSPAGRVNETTDERTSAAHHTNESRSQSPRQRSLTAGGIRSANMPTAKPKQQPHVTGHGIFNNQLRRDAMSLLFYDDDV